MSHHNKRVMNIELTVFPAPLEKRKRKKKGRSSETSGVSKNKTSYQGWFIINDRSFYIRSGTYHCGCPCQSMVSRRRKVSFTPSYRASVTACDWWKTGPDWRRLISCPPKYSRNRLNMRQALYLLVYICVRWPDSSWMMCDIAASALISEKPSRL